ncbi:hypothetical protein POM88_004766 [Heracleum sosnowskyi]|uniref:Uncharacterized protein n=1 Tax=Heracleum sosnowskyi TaxID=360622 RepID=A0AAD8JM67_9APIA|nr:hypothetical protein POM88_004766 [Heracleum sosnowskyi]
MHHLARNSTRGRSSRLPRWPDRLVFLLHGFWSESSGKACFVGSAPWYSSIGEPLRIWGRDKAVGQIWTNKTAQDVGYFGIIKFRTSDMYMKAPGFKYEYTVVEKVNKLCGKKTVSRGERYPSGHSYDMRFDMPVQNSEYFVRSYADPVFIGNKSYADNIPM